MWIPKKLKASNLGPFEKLDFSFLEGEVLFILGENHDDSGQESNGSGKSFLSEGITLSLFGESLRGLPYSELIRDGEEEMVLYFELFNTKYQESLKIERRFTKSSHKVRLLERDVKSSVGETSNEIIRLLGISKEDFYNYYLLSKEKNMPFFLMGDKKKKDVISRFSGAHLLSGIDKVIKQDITPIESEIERLNSEKDKLLGKILLLEEQIEVQKETFETGKAEQKKSITTNMLQLEEGLVEFNKSLEDFESKRQKNKEKLEGKEKELEALNKIQEYKEEIKTQEKTIREYGNILKEINQNFAKVEQEKAQFATQLVGFIECPACNHIFSTNENEIPYEELIQKLEKSDEELKDIEKDLGVIEETKTLFESDLEALEQEFKIYKENVEKVESEIRVLKAHIADQTHVIKEIELEVSTNEKKLEVLNKELDKLEETTLESVLEGFNIAKEHIEDEFKNVEVKIKNYQNSISEKLNWQEIFVAFYSYLANKTLEDLSGYTNFVLDRMKSNLSIDLEGFRFLADGKTLREEIEILVYKDEVPKGNFKRFSGGERARLVLANAVALQELINVNSESGGLDLLWIDEVIESIDGLGISSLNQSLKELSKTFILITHATNNVVADNILKAVKQNEVSTIMYVN